MPGTGISVAELSSISRHGLWLRLGDEELLLRFEDFPGFRKATVEQIMRVEQPVPDHLYWPLLDVDVSVASIRDPSAFPLVSRGE